MKPLRKQVAEVISDRIDDGILFVKPRETANLLLADAVIKAVLETVRCETCAHQQLFGRGGVPWCGIYKGYPPTEFGCKYWKEEKDEN